MKVEGSSKAPEVGKKSYCQIIELGFVLFVLTIKIILLSIFSLLYTMFTHRLPSICYEYITVTVDST